MPLGMGSVKSDKLMAGSKNPLPLGMGNVNTYGELCNYAKTIIKHAINNEVCEMDDKGDLIFRKTSKDECIESACEIFDEVVYQAVNAFVAARVLDRMYSQDTGKQPDMQTYMMITAEEQGKYNDYQYEFLEEEREIPDGWSVIKND